jgi:hypothetical protein
LPGTPTPEVQVEAVIESELLPETVIPRETGTKSARERVAAAGPIIRNPFVDAPSSEIEIARKE